MAGRAPVDRNSMAERFRSSTAGRFRNSKEVRRRSSRAELQRNASAESKRQNTQETNLASSLTASRQSCRSSDCPAVARPALRELATGRPIHRRNRCRSGRTSLTAQASRSTWTNPSAALPRRHRSHRSSSSSTSSRSHRTRRDRRTRRHRDSSESSVTNPSSTTARCPHNRRLRSHPSSTETLSASSCRCLCRDPCRGRHDATTSCRLGRGRRGEMSESGSCCGRGGRTSTTSP
ncbi:hypothetical protein AAT19DRAFT_16103 [Rhodotorula toruloides]|uniref:Uncharacterized protein n=1 Tax=Rhodotorula toruloides TaxID=5286 RepID=A0A2T0A5U7_RHOTO|nr:hypothetical protein AAT19DRAFT_16103 [Rhodotorula toruloides]